MGVANLNQVGYRGMVKAIPYFCEVIMPIIPDVGTVDVGNSPGFESDGVITLSTGETYLYGLYLRRPSDGPGSSHILDVQAFDIITIELGQKMSYSMIYPDNAISIPELPVIMARQMQDAYNAERNQL